MVYSYSSKSPKNHPKIEFCSKSWLFNSAHLCEGVQISKKSHFRVRGPRRGKKSPCFRKKYLEVRKTTKKWGFIDFSTLDFSILANFRWFSMIFDDFRQYSATHGRGPRPRGCKNLKKIRFGQKSPQTSPNYHRKSSEWVWGWLGQVGVTNLVYIFFRFLGDFLVILGNMSIPQRWTSISKLQFPKKFRGSTWWPNIEKGATRIFF